MSNGNPFDGICCCGEAWKEIGKRIKIRFDSENDGQWDYTLLLSDERLKSIEKSPEEIAKCRAMLEKVFGIKID